MKRKRIIASAFGAALAFAGCRTVLGIDDGATVTDAGATDAGSNEGAVSDGGDEADAIALISVFCKNIQPPPGFCADFDQDPFEKGFDNYGTTPDPGVGGGATLTPDTTLSKSAPRSARMTIPALLPMTNAESLLITTIPNGFAIIEAFVDVRVETEFFPDESGHVAIIGMSFNGAGGKYVEIRRTKEGAYLYTYDGQEIALLQPFPVGTWKNVELRFSFSTDAGRVDTYLDGVPAGGANLLPDFNQPDAYPRVIVGPSLAEGPIGDFKMNADNVVLRGTYP